jgi:putative membrane protein
MSRSAWMVLPVVALLTLAGCSSAPPPPPAPPPAPPAAPAPPPPPPGPPTASSDQDFINQALGAGAGEIGMARLARGKAQSREIRAFAEHMIVDHTQANKRLEALAKRLKIEVSPTPDQPPPELIAAGGPDFDKQYIGLAIKTHQDAIALFQSEATGGQDPRAKHLARSMLPELQHHLHMAEAIGKKLGL